ncbi:BnaAnng16960D [Brassica napus]|uniref:BnaAnng16960D protein n=1 Tax=Brassica napus TaxID=3708 RepID=A0A078J9B9_BRANA|nr:BnaAnng16960D [Brassica napus]
MITTTTMEMEMEIRKKRNMGLLTRLCLVLLSK